MKLVHNGFIDKQIYFQKCALYLRTYLHIPTRCVSVSSSRVASGFLIIIRFLYRRTCVVNASTVSMVREFSVVRLIFPFSPLQVYRFRLGSYSKPVRFYSVTVLLLRVFCNDVNAQ